MGDRSKLARVVRSTLASLAFAGSLIVGCGALPRTVDLAAFNPEYRIVIHHQGTITDDRVVAAGSSDEQIITQWLHAHQTGWQLDLTSYAPVRQIKGARFDLNFGGRTCVLNYDRTGKGDWVQVSRTIEESDALPELWSR